MTQPSDHCAELKRLAENATNRRLLSPAELQALGRLAIVALAELETARAEHGHQQAEAERYRRLYEQYFSMLDELQKSVQRFVMQRERETLAWVKHVDKIMECEQLVRVVDPAEGSVSR